MQISLPSPYYPQDKPEQSTRFIRPSVPSFPADFSVQSSFRLPVSLFLSPFPNSVDVEQVDCKKGDIPRCGTCGAYLSPFVHVNEKSRSWRCPICNHINSTIHFTHMYDMRTNVFDRKELHAMAYDIIPPVTLIKDDSYKPSFVIVIDESLIANNEQLRSGILAQIEEIKPMVKSGYRFALISMLNVVTLYSTKSKRGQSFTEFDPSMVLDREQYFTSNLDEIKEFVASINPRIIGKVQPLTVPAIEWATELIDRKGSHVFLYTSGQGVDDVSQIVKSFKDKAIGLTVFSLTPSKLESISHATGGYVYPFNQEHGLAQHFSIPKYSDVRVTIRHTDGAGWNPIGPTFVNDSEMLIPTYDSQLSLCIDFISKEIKQQTFFFQAAVTYYNPDGQQRTRIINSSYDVLRDYIGQVDEAALALAVVRTNTSLYATKKFYKEGSMIPQLLYRARAIDSHLIKRCSVERFILAALPSTMDQFSILFAKSMIISYPSAISDDALIAAASVLGIPPLHTMRTDDKSEFSSFAGLDEDYLQEYRNLSEPIHSLRTPK